MLFTPTSELKERVLKTGAQALFFVSSSAILNSYGDYRCKPVSRPTFPVPRFSFSISYSPFPVRRFPFSVPRSSFFALRSPLSALRSPLSALRSPFPAPRSSFPDPDFSTKPALSQVLFFQVSLIRGPHFKIYVFTCVRF